jgi:excisionase family DNA binding protein
MMIARPEVSGRAAYSVNEVCALAGLGRDTVYLNIRLGKLVARKLGRRTIITAEDLRSFLQSLPRFGGEAGSA